MLTFFSSVTVHCPDLYIDRYVRVRVWRVSFASSTLVPHPDLHAGAVRSYLSKNSQALCVKGTNST